MGSLPDALLNLQSVNLFDYIDQFEILRQLENTPQDKRWHAEGNVLIHTNMVLNEAYKLLPEIKDPEKRINVYLSAFFHDFGKPATTVKQASGKITSHGHEEAGVAVAREFMREYYPSMGPMRREFILSLVENHLAPLLLTGQNAQDKAYHKLSLKTYTDELAYLSLADTKGRIGQSVAEADCLSKRFNERCTSLGVLGKPYTLPGFAGENTLFYNTTRWMYLSNGLSLENQEKLGMIKKLTSQVPCELVIMVGAPGSGKSTWAKLNFPQMEYICMDELRLKLCGNAADQSKNKEVAELGFGELRSYLKLRKSVVWDATSTTAKLRKVLINTARQYGAYVTIVWMDTSLKTSLLRNAARDRVVPEDVVRNKHMSLQFPRAYEYDRFLLVPEFNVKLA